MKLSTFVAVVVSGTSWLTSVSAWPGSHATVRPRRTTSMLINPPAQPDLPGPSAPGLIASTTSLDLDDIQGDILIGMKKNKELFWFFGIEDVSAFKDHLANDIHPLVTTTNQLLSVDTQPETALNIAFSQAGLDELGVEDSLSDSLFRKGQQADAENIGDPGTSNWVDGYLGKQVHGVILLASDTIDNVNSTLASLKDTLGDSVKEIHQVLGQARPGAEEGHEHFGFMDGISQPAVDGFGDPLPGQQVVPPGVILLGHDGDDSDRPSWAKGGSLLVFRQLKQLVPEFDQFLAENPLPVPGFSPEEGSALLGARMVGRWKSGAPIDLTPFADDPELAADNKRNNDFTFKHDGEDFKSNQTRCPFSAHIRKTRPRFDIDLDERIRHSIIRAGIPYGSEVTDDEASSGKSDDSLERGLAFVAYQSDIDDGFKELQKDWANHPSFVHGKNDSSPGFDPIIGANRGEPRTVSGLDQTNFGRDFKLIIDFVVSRGGEYFFSPPVSAVKGTLAA